MWITKVSIQNPVFATMVMVALNTSNTTHALSESSRWRSDSISAGVKVTSTCML